MQQDQSLVFLAHFSGTAFLFPSLCRFRRCGLENGGASAVLFLFGAVQTLNCCKLLTGSWILLNRVPQVVSRKPEHRAVTREWRGKKKKLGCRQRAGNVAERVRYNREETIKEKVSRRQVAE